MGELLMPLTGPVYIQSNIALAINQPSYTEELTRSMVMLSEHPKTIFVGQSIRYDGQAMHKTFSGVPMDKRLEFPVAEDFQMGFCTGLALQGYIPVCCFPRMDFLLLACNQFVNHLDKLFTMGWSIPGQVSPCVIIRTAVGSTKPLNPGPQHTQDHTEAFRKILTTVHITEIDDPQTTLMSYKHALNLGGIHLMVEYMSLYD